MKEVYTITKVEDGSLALGAVFVSREDAESTMKDISKANNIAYQITNLILFTDPES